MNHEIALAWADALESGEYEQMRGHLRDAFGMCCLGVLCDLHAKETGSEWNRDDWFYQSGYGVPPPVVTDWCGANIQEDIHSGRKGLVTLAMANDLGATFSDIAAIIRRDWESL